MKFSTLLRRPLVVANLALLLGFSESNIQTQKEVPRLHETTNYNARQINYYSNHEELTKIDYEISK